MRGMSRSWPRAAATLVLCLLVGTAIVLHERSTTGATQAATDESHARHIMPETVPVAVAVPAPLPRNGWTVTADDAQDTAARVLDGNPDTIWRTASTSFPHQITIDTHNRLALSGLTYLPPPDSPDGRIGQYSVQISNDGDTWSNPVATGTFADDEVLKTVTIGTVVTRFVRLTAMTEAGGRGNLTAAAEINLLGGTDPALPRTGWSATVDSAEPTAVAAAANAIDGNTGSFWHTAYSKTPVPALPHWITVNMGTTNLVSGLAYLPRQDTSKNGTIGQYRVETSQNNVDWAPVAASGTFADDKLVKTVTFAPRVARYVRLTALSEAGNRGQWSSAAEVNILGRANPTLSRTGWTAAVSDQEAAYPVANLMDGNAATFWHSRYTPDPPAPFPHTITYDMKKVVSVGGLIYEPRPKPTPNGRIGKYKVSTSNDNVTWTDRITDGTFADNPATQTVVFPPVDARYVRLTTLSEAGNRGTVSSVAELYALGPAGSVSPKRGTWSAPVGFPLVPVAAAQLPNGKILTWSSFQPDTFGNGGGRTMTATYDPGTGVVTQRTVTETGHDMFCPGISALADGRILVTGGNDSGKTSIYDPKTDAWTTGPTMKTPRGYQASATLSDGRVFTIGGSWSGGHGGQNGLPHKAGEVWSASSGWTALPGADVVPMLTNDTNPNGDYRKDNHAWLFGWSGGKVFQAGPSKKMNWYGTSGSGSVTAAGTRGDDGDAMNGNAIMYDTGKILTLGGAPNYEQNAATANAYIVNINGSTVSTRKVASMGNTRSFANSVVLPDGKVVVMGGQNFAVPFSDNTAVLTAEMWDPVSEQFSPMASATVPRTYHSVGLLMPDGRVFSGGGGLCGTGCSTNHFNGQIFTPPYLLDENGKAASRPSITGAPTTAANGAKITVQTNRDVTAFSIIRMGTATHSVDTDQRRLSLVPTPAAGGGYELTIPSDPGIALPGYWMLFAMDAKGVPSIAKTIKIG
jgi:galactose oxidase